MPSHYFIFAIDDQGKEHPAGVWEDLNYACWSHSGTSSRGALYNNGKALKGLRYERRDGSYEGAPVLMKETLSAREMRANGRKYKSERDERAKLLADRHGFA